MKRLEYGGWAATLNSGGDTTKVVGVADTPEEVAAFLKRNPAVGEREIRLLGYDGHPGDAIYDVVPISTMARRLCKCTLETHGMDRGCVLSFGVVTLVGEETMSTRPLTVEDELATYHDLVKRIPKEGAWK